MLKNFCTLTRTFLLEPSGDYTVIEGIKGDIDSILMALYCFYKAGIGGKVTLELGTVDG